jgi:hypothetical protein
MTIKLYRVSCTNEYNVGEIASGPDLAFGEIRDRDLFNGKKMESFIDQFTYEMGDAKTMGDFLWLTYTGIAFKREFKPAFQTHISREDEVLPLKTTHGAYSALNVLRTVPALSHELCDWKHSGYKQRRMWPIKWALHEDIVSKERSFFRIEGLHAPFLFAAEQENRVGGIAQTVMEMGWTGLSFSLLDSHGV